MGEEDIQGTAWLWEERAGRGGKEYFLLSYLFHHNSGCCGNICNKGRWIKATCLGHTGTCLVDLKENITLQNLKDV